MAACGENRTRALSEEHDAAVPGPPSNLRSIILTYILQGNLRSSHDPFDHSRRRCVWGLHDLTGAFCSRAGARERQGGAGRILRHTLRRAAARRHSPDERQPQLIAAPAVHAIKPPCARLLRPFSRLRFSPQV